jgi:serine/threonine protein kinase
MDVEMATEFANLMFESPTETGMEGENDVLSTFHPREMPALSQQQQQQQQAYPTIPPLPIPDEVFEPSFRDRGVTQPTAMVIPLGRTEAVPTMVEVMKQDNPQRAYGRIDSWRPRSLSHGGPEEWGHLYLGYILERVNNNDNVDDDRATTPIFRQPLEEDVQRVAIKRLFKSVLDAAQQRGEHENPDCELFRMNTIGDDIHVLSCIEALEDDMYLYIISPFAEGQTVGDHIPLSPSSNDPVAIEHQARVMFHELLQDLQYLHDDHAICHRDVSPGNCLVHQGRIVLNDLAMSHRIPRPSTQQAQQQALQRAHRCSRDNDWRRVGWISNFGCFGKPPYWPPEVALPLTGGGVELAEGVHAPSCDLWAAVVILFHLVTGCNFYHFPYCGDRIFRIFVMCGGLAPAGSGVTRHSALLERAWEEIQAPAERPYRNHVITIRQKLQRLSPRVQELLFHVFQMNPHDRWTMEEVLNCDWMKLGPG